MSSITKECSQISRHIGGAQLDLDQHQEMDGRQRVFAKPHHQQSDRSRPLNILRKMRQRRAPEANMRGIKSRSCDCEPIIWVFAQKSAVCPVGRWSRLHALYHAQGFPLDTECDRWDRSSGMRATARARQRREGCSVEGGVET